MILNNQKLKILEEFSEDYSKRIYGRAIAKKLSLNQKTVSNVLLALEGENILKFAKEGKNKYYFLNRFNPHIKEIIKLIEIGKKINFLEKHKNIRRLFDEIEKRSKGICVIFGSYAKGSETKDSDLDIFLAGDLSSIKDLEETYQISINVIKAKKINLENDTILNEVLKNHIVLKGIEEFMELIKW